MRSSAIAAQALRSTSSTRMRNTRKVTGILQKALLTSGGATTPPNGVNAIGVDHIVLLKLRSDVTDDQIQALHDGVASLAQIDGVDSVTVGRMFVEDWMQDRRGDQGINYGIRVRLASKESLKEYQSHPDHVRVIRENIAPLLHAPVLAYDWVAPESTFVQDK